MNILLFGGTGFVGKHFVTTCKQKFKHIYIVSRSPETYQNCEKITYIPYNVQASTLPPIDVVINLAGESLFGYWTKRKKEAILKSRISTTKKSVQLIQEMKQKPKVFINSSAVGFYGTSKENIFTENTITPGDDYLSFVVKKWEDTAKEVEAYDVRTVYARFGIILGKEGSLPLMSLPVKMFAGGKIGSGNQWVSWIDIDDCIALLLHCIEKEDAQGPINFTAPYPVRNKDLMKAISKTLRRPYYFHVPTFLLRIILGEMNELITKGQYVLPKKAKKLDYIFKYPKIEKSLRKHL